MGDPNTRRPFMSSALLPRRRLHLRAARCLAGAELRDALDQLRRHRLRQWKAKRTFAGAIRRERAFEGRRERIAGRIERVVRPPRCQPQERTLFELVGRDLITDHLDRIWNSLANDVSDSLQRDLKVPRLDRDVFVYG